MSKQGNFLYYFTLAMTAIYAFIGLYIMFSDNMAVFLGNKRFAFGPLFILYAFYRAYRIYSLNKQMHKQSDDGTRD